jgi:hypothetical protein
LSSMMDTESLCLLTLLPNTCSHRWMKKDTDTSYSTTSRTFVRMKQRLIKRMHLLRWLMA